MALLGGYFAAHEGEMFSDVFIVLLLATAGIGALLGIILILLPLLLGNALLALALLIFLDVHFGISSIIATWMSINLVWLSHGSRQLIGLLTLLGLVLFPAWTLGRLFSQMLAAAMLVFFVSSLLQPMFSTPRTLGEGIQSGGSSSADHPKGKLILHIILDELAAPETISPYLPNGPAYEAEFKDFFIRHGFQLETPYKVPFNLTGFAIPALLNSLPVDTPKAQLMRQWQLPFKQFSDWKQAGYQVQVVGVDFVSPCQGENSRLVDQCYLFPAFSLAPILASDYSLMEKSLRVMERIFWGSGLVQRGCKAPGASCPPNLNASMSWYALEQIAAVKRIVDSTQRDVAIFAHILAPHLPLYYGQDCQRNYRRSDEVLENRVAFYSAYADQTVCILNSLSPLIESVVLHWEEATVTIQGDHGLRVPITIDGQRRNDESGSYLTVRAIKEHRK
jgi:hypothetical protein